MSQAKQLDMSINLREENMLVYPNVSSTLLLYSSTVSKLPVGFYLRDWEEMIYTNQRNILGSKCLHIHTEEMSMRCRIQNVEP